MQLNRNIRSFIGLHRLAPPRYNSTTLSRSFLDSRTKFTSWSNLAKADNALHSAFGRRIPLIFKAAGVAGVGLGISAISTPSVYCDTRVSRRASPETVTTLEVLPPPPSSSVGLYQLTFGTVCGVCAGVFIKKGAKAVAFFVGGIFVLLQYLGSLSVVRVDWSRMGTRFESLFYSRQADGSRRAPSLYQLWNFLVDFLTADFQPRASFVAGLALGLRIG